MPEGPSAVSRALAIGVDAARVGFDWPDAFGPLEKIREEASEVEEALRASPDDHRRLTAEVGDLLFSTVNLARKLGVDPEVALEATIEKFNRRFRFVLETLQDSGRAPQEATLEELEAIWQRSKVLDA